MTSHGDIHIVRGMDAILNPDNIKPGINLKELEHQMINSGLIVESVRDPSDKLSDELDIMAKKLGISLDEFSGKKKTPASTKPLGYSASSQTQQLPQSQQLRTGSQTYSSLSQQTLDGGDESSESPDDSEQSDDDQEYDHNDNNDQNSTQTSDYNSQSSQGQSTQHQLSQNQSSQNQQYDYTNQNYQYAKQPQYNQQPYHSSDRSEFAQRTREQERRDHIDSVMGSMDNTQNFSLEKEKREESKYSMLAEIDSLVTFLTEEQIDISRIPKVDRASDYNEIESVLRMLRHKNDHNRYCSFADEFLISGAYILEELFDGKRTWFNRYTPDLTGWHNHVNVKLKRMQYDTGQIVSGIMQENNIGPTARVALELLPSMLIYSRTRRRQHDQPNLFSDDQMADVNTRIRTS